MCVHGLLHTYCIWKMFIIHARVRMVTIKYDRGTHI